MATPENRSNTQQNQGKPPDAPPSQLLPSQIAAEVTSIVTALEKFPENSQRRILESVRVSLGLMPKPEQVKK